MGDYRFTQNKSPDDLEHFGIKRRSGRYKWGSGKRPYQSGGGLGIRKETPEQREERKKEVLRTGRSAKELAEFANELSYKELNDALDRIKLNAKLNEAVASEQKKGEDKIKDVLNKIGLVNSFATEGIKILNEMNAVLDLKANIPKAKQGEYNKYQQYSGGKGQSQKNDKK